MYKRIFIIKVIFIISFIFLNSCGLWRARTNMLNQNNYDKKADIQVERIFTAIQDKDKKTLKSLFSKKALDEVVDIDKNIDYLFELLQGDVDTWERETWSSSESIDHGKKSVMIRFSFELKTNQDIYVFYVIDYHTDDINPDNQGLYMLELIKFTDDKDLQSWQKRMRAGIYIH